MRKLLARLACKLWGHEWGSELTDGPTVSFWVCHRCGKVDRVDRKWRQNAGTY